MANKQPVKLSPRHAGKLDTVSIEDTPANASCTAITRLYVRGMKTQT